MISDVAVSILIIAFMCGMGEKLFPEVLKFKTASIKIDVNMQVTSVFSLKHFFSGRTVVHANVDSVFMFYQVRSPLTNTEQFFFHFNYYKNPALSCAQNSGAKNFLFVKYRHKVRTYARMYGTVDNI